MTRLGADVDQLDLLAKSFDTAATRLDGQASVVEGQLRSLWWRGSIADRFTATWASVDRRNLATVAETLRNMAAVVRRNAQQQREASGSAGGGWGHILPHYPSAPYPGWGHILTPPTPLPDGLGRAPGIRVPDGTLIPVGTGGDGSGLTIEAHDTYGSTGDSSFTGIRYAHVDGDAWNNLVGDDGFRLGVKEGGLRAGFDENGEFIAKAGYEATILNANLDGTIIGNENLGLTGGLEAEILSAEVGAGYEDGSIGAEVGVNFVSAEGELGANVGGVNVSAHGEIGLKAELGISIGQRTEIKLPFITVGFSLGL